MPPRSRTETVAGEAAKGPYRFTRGGKKYTLPRFDSIKPGIIRRVRKLDQADAMFTILEQVADEETLAVLDDMEMPDFDKVIVGWAEHSGVSLPE